MTINFNAIGDLRDAVSQRLINLEFRQANDAPFRSSIQPILTSGDIRVVRWAHTPGSTYRDYQHIKDGDESWSLIYPVNCSITVTHLDSDHRLASGHPTLLRHDAVGEIGSERDCSYIAVVLSPSVLKQSALKDRLCARPYPHDLPSVTLLRAYVSLLATRSALIRGDLEAIAARHLVDILRLSALEAQECVAETNSYLFHSRLELAIAFINETFRDPTLSVASVASAQQISPRYLHKILERGKINFTKYVNMLRLDATYAALTAKVALPISNIALDCGFSDFAHFNRLFKRRFGLTPSAVRGVRSDMEDRGACK